MNELNQQLLTITLLLMNGGFMLFVLYIVRNGRALKEMSSFLFDFWMNEDFQHRKTRERIAQVKTRLADEERDDQKAKTKTRREVRG